MDIPGWRSLQLEVLLLDVNGTLALDGDLLAGVDAGLKAFEPGDSLGALASGRIVTVDGDAGMVSLV